MGIAGSRLPGPLLDAGRRDGRRSPGYPEGHSESRGRNSRRRAAMSNKAFTVTRAEARELRRRAERVSRTGGIPHAEVVAEMRRDMDRELRAMVHAYKHPGRKLTVILECMAIAREEGLDISEAWTELLDKIA